MPAPIHVLHIVDGLRVGGAETLLCNLVRGLPRERYRVSVAYSTPGPLIEQVEAAGIWPTRLRRLATIDPLIFFREILQLIRRDPPQIVHTHLFKSDVHGRPAARLAGVPVVVSALQNCNDWATNPLFGRAYGLNARWADRLIAASEEVREFSIRHMALDPAKVITIANSVPTERFVGNEAAGQALRAELQIAADAPLLGIVARLMPQKDHATFLNAAAIIARELPTARFLVAGEGPLRSELEAQTRALGLEQAVIFAGLRRDVPALLAALDLLVFSSRWEGLPIAMLEGMASGVPVLATAVSGIPGVISSGQHGLLVPPSDPAALAEAAIRLVRDRAEATRLGRAGQELVNERYSIAAAVRRTAALYEELLAARGVTTAQPSEAAQ